MNTDEIVNAFQSTHNSAVKAASKKMPEIDATVLIDLLVAVSTNEKTPEATVQELARKYKAPMDTYIRTFEKIGKQKAVDYLLSSSKVDGLQSLAGTDFSKELIRAAEKAEKIVQKYYAGELTGEEFLEKLWNSGIVDVSLKAAKACGFDAQSLINNCKQLTTMSIVAVSYAAATEAYNILMQVMADATAQHIETFRIQAECQRSVEQIRQYRTEMEELISKYMQEHLETFESGFSAMDQAILANDTNGYLKGNAEIQKILGHEVQFETKEEFDDLMNSDASFKL